MALVDLVVLNFEFMLKSSFVCMFRLYWTSSFLLVLYCMFLLFLFGYFNNNGCLIVHFVLLYKISGLTLTLILINKILISSFKCRPENLNVPIYAQILERQNVVIFIIGGCVSFFDHVYVCQSGKVIYPCLGTFFSWVTKYCDFHYPSGSWGGRLNNDFLCEISHTYHYTFITYSLRASFR